MVWLVDEFIHVFIATYSELSDILSALEVSKGTGATRMNHA